MKRKPKAERTKGAGLSVSTERRVILAFAVTVLVGVALVALSLRHTLQRVLLERAGTHLESRARVLASQCESELLEAQRDLVFLAGMPEFQQLAHTDRVDPAIHGVSEDVETDKRALLAALMGKSESFSVLYVLQPNGDLYLVNPFPVQLAIDRPSLAERPYYQEAVRTKAPVISDSFVGADGILAVAMLVPVLGDTGDVIAYVGGAFHLTHLSQLVNAERIRPFDAGFILDRHGQLAAHTDTGLLQPGDRERFSATAPAAGLHAELHAHEANAQAGDHVHSPEWPDPADGKRYMAELVHLGMDWHLGLLRDRAAVLTDARTTVRGITGLVSLLLLVISGVGIGVAHRIGRRWDAAEHALAESEETARSLLNASPDPSLLLDTQGAILGLNEGAVKALGQPRERLLGVLVFDLFPPSLATGRKARVDEVIRTGKAVRFEDDMGDRAYDNGIYPVTNDAGEVRQVAVLARDITERRAATQALHASEQRFRSTFEQAAVGIAHVAPDGSWQRVNQKLCDIVGYTRDELMRLTFQDITHPDDLDTDLAYVEQMLAGEIQTYSMEKRYIRKDGSEVWINLTVALVRHGDGEPAFFISVVEDISARKQAEAVLQERVKELNCLHSLGRIVEEEDGALDELLEASVSLLPPAWRFPDDATARIVWGDRTFQSGGDLGAATARLSASLVVEGGEAGTVEVAYRQDHPAVDEGPFLHQERALLDTFAGRLSHIVERSEARGELRRHREHLEKLVQERTEELHRQKAVLEAINDVFVEALASETEEELAQACLAVAEKLSGSSFGFIGEVNPDGRFDTIAISNPGWDACRMPHSDAVAAIRNMEVRGIWSRPISEGRSCIVNEPTKHPHRVGTPEGHPEITAFLGVPLKRAGTAFGTISLGNKLGGYELADQEGVEALAVAIVVALDSMRARQQVKQYSTGLETANQELEAFAYSVSHDLRSPLRGIDGYSKILLEDHLDKLDDDGQFMLRQVRGSAQEMGELIEDLLAFSRLGRKALNLGRVDMVRAARSVFRELQEAHRDRELTLEAGELPPATGDSALIREVLRNLLGNAVKFTRTRDVAVIEVGTTDAVPALASKKGGGAVCLTDTHAFDTRHLTFVTYFVRDNGVGFDMAYVDKLFQVFQRLHGKDAFEGTGIGLALVKRIVDRHSGQVWAEGEVDKGATFYFTLPRSDA